MDASTSVHASTLVDASTSVCFNPCGGINPCGCFNLWMLQPLSQAHRLAQHAPSLSWQVLSRLFNSCAGLLGAVKALRESLQQLGSNLLVLTGDMEDVIPQAAALHGASSIILEEEVEYK